MLSGYNAVKILAREHPDWLPAVEASLKCAKEYQEFAGKWVLEELKRGRWLGLRFGNKRVKWLPGLRMLASYEILRREDTAKGGRRAYYSMPDALVEQADSNDLTSLKNSSP